MTFEMSAVRESKDEVQEARSAQTKDSGQAQRSTNMERATQKVAESDAEAQTGSPSLGLLNIKRGVHSLECISRVVDRQMKSRHSIRSRTPHV